MSRAIWKYTLEYPGATDQEFEMPVGAQFRAARLWSPGLPPGYIEAENARMDIWFEIDPEAERETAVICVRGTGWEIESDLEYLATVFDDPIVWHLFVGLR